jgi:LuxR family maltose regulon positive regulatory protein
MQPIRAKLLIPRLTPDLVPRPQLVARLNAGLVRKFTLISAPPGFGKTTLLGEWLQQASCPAAWVTLDEGDDDLYTFLNYVVAAVQIAYPASCQETQSLLNVSILPPPNALVAALANDLAALPGELILVLDDLHVLQQLAIHNLLDSLITYLAPGVHLALGTRTDPPLSLSMLRARGHVTELRQRDLRFTPAETRTFLRQAGQLAVDEQMAVALEERADGWAAALRLLLLTMQGEDEQYTAAMGLGQGNTYVMAYLSDQALARQPAQVQEFLLRSAIVERFCLPLCCVLGTNGVGAEPYEPESHELKSYEEVLARIQRDNLFVTALGEGWYRYHPLFRELLLHRLEIQVGPAAVAQLHRRASGWYETQGMVSEAIQHALQAGDEEVAVAALARHRVETMNREQWQHLERWLALFPHARVEQHPILTMTQAWLFHTQFCLAEYLPLLRRVTAQLAAAETQLDPATRQMIQGEVDALSSQVLLYQGQFQAAQELAQRSLELLPLNHSEGRGVGYIYLASGRHYQGDAAGAQEVMARGMQEDIYHNNTFGTRILIGQFVPAFLAFDVAAAERTANQIMTLAEERGLTESAFWAEFYLGLLAYERARLDAAQQHFEHVIAHRYVTHLRPALGSHLGLALVYQAQGQDAEAMHVAAEAAAFAREFNNQNLSDRLLSFQALLALLQGRTDEATAWAEHIDRQSPFVPTMWTDYAPVTLVMTLLTEASTRSLAEAEALLPGLQQKCHTYNARLMLAKLLALQARLHELRGEREAAFGVLEEAVLLAQPGRPLRLFADLGQANSHAINCLLRTLAERGVASEYSQRILAAAPPNAHRVPQPPPDLAQAAQLAAVSGRSRKLLAAEQELIEPLTRRELEVLALLAQGLLNKEIGQQLFIASKTVERHTLNIYAKLGVKNRSQAAARARELHLLLR